MALVYTAMNAKTMFAEIYQAAQARGFIIKAHAGELPGAEHVSDTPRTIAAAHALTQQEIAQLQINVFAGATLPEEQKPAVPAEIAALLN